MGKRKYGSDKTELPKKAKKEESSGDSVNEAVDSEQPQIENDDENETKSLSKPHGFDIKHFRKELATKQGQTMVLTQFLQVCLNPDNKTDLLLEYLKVGGNSHEILRQISQDNKKNLTLATPAFHIFHLIILKVQSSLPHMISVTEEACRYFLNTFMPTVEIMISENSGPRHRKIILKLLTSMVTLNPDLGIEVLNQAPLTPKHLQYIVEKVNYKEKDNVRTSFVHFMTSFLIDGHLPLIKALLEKQGLLALVIPGLIQDDAEAVLMFLNILKKNVIDNNFISKSLKLKTFSHQVLHNLFKIFSWKGPPELSNDDRNVARPEIMNLLSDIISTLFTSHRLGLYFLDPSLGTADANKNQNLYKALLSLKRPWENEHECETILKIVYKCPDLHRAVISIIEQSFEPQHSPIWERVTSFVIKLLDKMKPEEMVPRMTTLSSNQVANFVRFMTLPVPLLKFIQTNLNKDHTVSLYCIKVLVKMLQTLRRYIQILQMNDTQHIVDVKNRLEYFVPKHLPTPSVVVGLIQNVIEGKHQQDQSQDYKLPEINNTAALISLIDLLLLYNDIHPAFFETLEGSIDMKKLLDFSASLCEGNKSVLKFKVVSLWLTLDASAISLKNPMFKNLFHIMLEVYANDEEDTWIEAKDTLHKFFRNTSIFEADEDEIHLILYTLRNSKVNPISLIGDIVEYVLANNKELTEYVRNQFVHFEISDENSEANLNKLFDDLMENRNTQDSVFLENKVPSPFIVGCLQYIQNNKDVKKNLKPFLSLYVANLFHINYSPELTEVLMGDSKLDIRKYVGTWTSQPVSLPEAIVGRDVTLKDMSKSIIENEDISLTDIFPCLQEAAKEESDFTVNEVSYRINVTGDMDSSELLIWSKYLIFCTVRLADMKMLSEEQQNKISQYFECLIQIGRKHHLVDTCRTIILSIFKNPHVLRIYTLLDLGKDESSIIATKFLLQIITQHEDIVKYLNRKYNLLKSYQQKNFSEIIRALIKINKRKNVNSKHTTEILYIIGLSKEDDTRVFNQIFATELSACIKDDKEPSLVLELLKVLIDKYSKSIGLELQLGVMKKSLKLYTDLLTNTEVTPNLTNLENALVKYFENKPHHIGTVTDEHFKKFFTANTIRKSTSQLAAILLKLNPKFCTIFKEQISRPEILSQRELTLPLGNALLQHNQFLVDNKELLMTIYGEYQTNISKLLEKPHKAGQIYIACWNFVRKLIVECMGSDECEKFFSKSHKFESVELCHVHLMQAMFLKLCIMSKPLKKDLLINYFLNILNIITNGLKESKDVDAIKVIASDVLTVTQASTLVTGFNIEAKEEFKKLTESVTWQNFCKAVLKDSLRIKTATQSNTCGPQLLQLLSSLVKLIYPEDHEGTQMLFDMVTSHSEFLNVMLSHHSSDIKSRLVEFIYVLISKNKSLMKSQQIPVYLSAYHATRSPCDRMILTVLHYYESNGLPVNDYKPYVFGDSAANHYAVRKNRSSSLWAHPTPNQVLNLFEKEIIERTITNFPVTKKLDYIYELRPSIEPNIGNTFERMSKDGLFKPRPIKDNEAAINNLILKIKYDSVLTELKTRDLVNVSHVEEDEGIYDPVFVLSLLSHLLAPGSAASCFKLLRTGLLSLPVMALASHCPLMRAAAYHVLHRFCMLLETETRHKNDKLFLTDFINTLRQSLVTAVTQNAEENIENLRSPRLPAVDALYLAKALMVSTAPMDPLYKPVNNFFIAKQMVDLTVVPDFLSLFHDSDVESVERRKWVLDIIKNGTKTMTDVNVLFKTMCLKMMMDFNSSVLSDRKTHDRVISALSSIASIPRACEILVEGYGLISWLHSFVRQLKKEDRTNVKSVLNLIENILRSMTVNAFAKNLNAVGKNGKPLEFMELKPNKDVENEILIILYNVLPIVETSEADDMTSYVRIYTLLTKRVIKSLSKKQMLNLVNKIGDFYKENEGVRLLTKAVVKSDTSILRSNNLQFEECLLQDLSAVVKCYLYN